MNTTHHGAPSWKAELLPAERLLSEIDNFCLKLANGVVRGLHKIGLHKVAECSRRPAPT